MKLRHVFLIILLIIVADQVLKIWVKTSFTLHSPDNVRNVFGGWFKLHFIENDGMAWGMRLGTGWGKTVLTLFRLFAVIFGTWYLFRIVKKEYTKGFIICAALIYAGALGNLIDSMFYGMIFDKGMLIAPDGNTENYYGLAKFSSNGYSSFLHGNVVDMLYFDLFRIKNVPDWIPFIGGGEFQFFNAIFNIADASISIGVITLLLFQKRFIKKLHPEEKHATAETSTEVSDQAQVS